MAEVVVITGASSGIGRALALHYAKAGVVLGLAGRDPERLEDVCRACTARGAKVVSGLFDIRDRQAVSDWLLALDDAGPVTLLVANAGIAGGTQQDGGREDAAPAAAQIEVNLQGVLNTVHPLLPRMAARGRGQIALMSSIAALVPLPDSIAYGASKAAVLYYGRALRQNLAGTGLRISVICPGFVTSPMSARYSGWKPLEMSAERAAAIVARGLRRNRPVIAFPRSLALAARIGAVLPEGLRHAAMKPFGFTIARMP